MAHALGTFNNTRVLETSFSSKVKENGKKQRYVWIKFETTDDDGNKNTISNYFTVEGGAAQYSVESLLNLGWEGDFLEFNQGKYDDSLCQLVITEREWGGKKYNNVKINTNNASGWSPEKDDEAAAEANEEYGALVRKIMKEKSGSGEPF